MSQIEKLKKAALVKGDHSKVEFEFHAFPFRLRKQSAWGCAKSERGEVGGKWGRGRQIGGGCAGLESHGHLGALPSQLALSASSLEIWLFWKPSSTLQHWWQSWHKVENLSLRSDVQIKFQMPWRDIDWNKYLFTENHTKFNHLGHMVEQTVPKTHPPNICTVLADELLPTR